MISFLSCYKGITIIQVFTIIISFVTCDPTDIDLPYLSEMTEYLKYTNRSPTREGQIKLTPEEFFKSIYNISFLRMPRPHSAINYDRYKINFENAEKFNPEIFLEEAQTLKKTNPQLAAVQYKNYQLATEFLKTNVQPFSREDYYFSLASFVLLPKFYETKDNYHEARAKFGDFLRKITPGLPEKVVRIPIDSKVNITEFYKEPYLANESYRSYVVRMVHNGRMPLNVKKYNLVYGTSFEDKVISFQ